MALKDKLKILSSLLLAMMICSSCANIGLYEELGGYIKNIFTEPEDVDPSLVEKVKFASMQMRLGKNPNTLIVLEEDNQGILKWTSSNDIKIYTHEGIITRFMGLENELSILEIDKNHPILIENINKEKEVNLTSFYTFKNPDLFRLPVKTKFYYAQSVDMIFLGESIKADIYKEEALDNLIGWKFTNFFWIHQDTKKVIKSTQSITPKNPKVFYTITREYIKQ